MSSELSIEEIRAEVEAWLDENWDESLTVGEWWDRLGPSGYAHPMLGTNAYGKGYSQAQAAAVMATMADREVMGPPTGLGRMLALTPSSDVNRLAARHFGEVFGRQEVYRLSPRRLDEHDQPVVAQDVDGRLLFDYLEDDQVREAKRILRERAMGQSSGSSGLQLP